MTGHSHRLNQGCVVHLNVIWQFMKRMSRHIPYILQSAIRIKTKELQIMTNMLVPCFTCGAIIAMIKRANNHFLPHFKACHTCANAINKTRHFVTNHTLKPNARIHMTCINMHICAANTHIGNPYTNLSLSRRLIRL